MTIDPADIAALREQGDLKGYLLSLTGRVPAQPKPTTPAEAPAIRICRPGAWPHGSRATGPVPATGGCPHCGESAAP